MEYFETTLEPYSRIQDLYQSYYRASISKYCEKNNIIYREKRSHMTGLLRFLGRVRNSDRFNSIAPARIRAPLLDSLASLVSGGAVVDHAVGKYVYHGAGKELKICVDAEDAGEIKRPELLEWSDLYFKTNYWPDREYDEKVLPLANVNPLVLTRREELRDYRNCEFDWDLFGFFRVWGRIEHNIALFEALAQVKCKKKLIAYIVSQDYASELDRLEKAGIAVTMSPISLKTLWNLAARSKLNIVRHGVEDCIPWRMTDIMAMGHCPVLDYRARTQWHIPLLENVHYLSLDVPPEGSLSPKEFASRVVERIEGWLSQPELITRVATNAGAYFDENLEPERLGDHLVELSRKSFRGYGQRAV
jgi:hypothetical protein